MITAVAMTTTDGHDEGAVRLDVIAADRWRAVDARRAADDVDAVLGFVCLTAGLYEVTRAATPLEMTFCGDLPAVRATLIDGREWPAS